MTQHIITGENKENTFLSKMNNCHFKPQSHVGIPGFLFHTDLSQVTVKKSGSFTFPKHHLAELPSGN